MLSQAHNARRTLASIAPDPRYDAILKAAIATVDALIASAPVHETLGYMDDYEELDPESSDPNWPNTGADVYELINIFGDRHLV